MDCVAFCYLIATCSTKREFKANTGYCSWVLIKKSLYTPREIFITRLHSIALLYLPRSIVHFLFCVWNNIFEFSTYFNNKFYPCCSFVRNAADIWIIAVRQYSKENADLKVDTILTWCTSNIWSVSRINSTLKLLDFSDWFR